MTADDTSSPKSAATTPPLERLSATTRDLHRHASIGVLTCFLLIGGLGVWAATTEIAGAVVTQGFVVVDGNSRKVQHPAGGIVGEIAVRNGVKVRAGDVVMRLDETQIRASLGVIQSQLVQLTARRARLEAERDSATEVRLPAGFEAEGAEAIEAAAGERRFFEARRRSSEGQKEQYRERIRQLEQEITGLTAQRKAKDGEAKIQRAELARLDPLYSRYLVNEVRMSALKRDLVRLEGELGTLDAQIARARAQISQIELAILQVDQDLRTEAQKDLRETEGKIAELIERRLGVLDQLRRVDIRAPIDGFVHELAVHTVGGVIQAGETLMLIVPSGDALAIEARISPAEIDQVAVGRSATLRFATFNRRTTPEVKGVVTHVAADLTREAQTGATYFLVRIRLDDAEAEKLAGRKIVPGMPVEAFIETGERTALSYLVKPMLDSIRRGFREP